MENTPQGRLFSGKGTSAELAASTQDLSSPPFGVIQTRRHVLAAAFACFRCVGSGALIVGTDTGVKHPVNVNLGGFLPQIYRRVFQKPSNAGR